MEPVEGPWALPDGWRWERLGNLGAWYGGGTPSKSAPAFWTDGTIPWVSPKDMKVARICDSEDHITEAAVRESTARLVPSGSVVCVMRSGILRHTFPVAVTAREVTLNQDLRALRPREGLSADFIAHFLRRYEQTILSKCSKDGTTVNSIDTERLLACPVPLPDRETQRRIVACIDELFAEIEEGERALAEARAGVETYRKALLKAAVTGELTADWRSRVVDDRAKQCAEQLSYAGGEGGLRRRRHAKIFEPDLQSLPRLPRNWRWVSWSQVGEAQNGRAFPSSEYCNEGVRLLRPGNLAIDGTVVWSEKNTRLLPMRYLRVASDLVIRGNELVMNLTAQSLEDEFLGRVCLTEADELCILNQRLARLTPLDATPDFMLLIFKSPMFRLFVSRLNTGSLIQHMYTSQLAQFVFPLPPSDEQVEIVDQHKRLVLSENLNVRMHSTTLRQSILAAAFRGELAA